MRKKLFYIPWKNEFKNCKENLEKWNSKNGRKFYYTERFIEFNRNKLYTVYCLSFLKIGCFEPLDSI